MLVKNSGIVVTSAPVSIVNDRGVSLTRTFYGGVMERQPNCRSFAFELFDAFRYSALVRYARNWGCRWHKRRLAAPVQR